MKKTIPRVPEAWNGKSPVQAKFPTVVAQAARQRAAQPQRTPVSGPIQRNGPAAALPVSSALVARRLPAVPAAYVPKATIVQRKQSIAGAGAGAAVHAMPPVRAGRVAATPLLAAFAPRLPAVQAWLVQRSAPANSKENEKARKENEKARKDVKKEMEGQFSLSTDTLDGNAFLYTARATGGSATLPPNTTATLRIEKFKSQDLGDAKVMRQDIATTLKSPKKFRNVGSDSAIHNNNERRLPHYTAEALQPNLEYTSASGGGRRIIVDVLGRRVYLSHHYGDDTAKAASDSSHPQHAKSKAILQYMTGKSAHVELDPASWALGPILDDAQIWWGEIQSSLEVTDTSQ